MNLRFKYHYLLPFLARLPQNVAYRLASLSGRFSIGERVAEKEVIIQQMQAVFSDKSRDELAQITDYFFGMVEREALDTWFFRTCKTQKQIDRFIQLENFHYVTDARQAGRSVIISSGHFGRFWMTGIGMRAQGVTIGSVARDGGETNEHGLPELEYQYRLKKLAWLKQRFGGTFWVEGGSVRAIYRALEKDVMGVMIDVPYEGDEKSCIQLPFLGRTARFSLGPAKIAKRANALIVPYYTFESRAGLLTKFYAPLDPEHLSEQEIMTQLISQLEQLILAYPELNWMWPALPLMWQE